MSSYSNVGRFESSSACLNDGKFTYPKPCLYSNSTKVIATFGPGVVYLMFPLLNESFFCVYTSSIF